jgi:alpha-D-ribose 1-methylphosphonate 5-triphosphate synthase subunit PhnI
MQVRRRISATYKDLPGGQVLGPTFDYTHRLIDFALAADGDADAVPPAATASPDDSGRMVRVTDIIAAEDLIEANPAPQDSQPVGDLTRDPLGFPAGRDLRLQNLARGDEGFLLALGYSTQRGYGRNHPFVGEIRMGEVEVELFVEDLGFAVPLGDITVTECQMVNQFKGSLTEPPRFTRGYGLGFGHCERKAMSMALVDRALRADEFDEERKGRDPSNLEAAMVVGFCGGYTSYSAFVASLHEGLTGQLAWPIGLAAATIVLCPLAAALGMRASGRGKGGYPPNPGGGAGRGPEKEPA